MTQPHILHKEAVFLWLPCAVLAILWPVTLLRVTEGAAQSCLPHSALLAAADFFNASCRSLSLHGGGEQNEFLLSILLIIIYYSILKP